MLTGGGFATIEPGKTNFNKKVAKVHKITDQQLLLQAPSHLKCPVSNKLLDNAVMLPCCHQSVDDERMRQVGLVIRDNNLPLPNRHVYKQNQI